MIRLTDPAQLQELLNSEWQWAGFALGDLDPALMPLCEFRQEGETIVLLFSGLSPRLVCDYGDRSHLAELLATIEDERIWANIRPESEDSFREFYRLEKCVKMRRMFLDGTVEPTGEAVRLRVSDREEIEDLLKQGEWVLFLPHALEGGHYHGVRKNGRMVAVAGTHLASSMYNIAALGTVFTHPDYRGTGLGRACVSHVLASVGGAGISRIILNVEEEKSGARRLYESFGFQTALTYLDGQCARITL